MMGGLQLTETLLLASLTAQLFVAFEILSLDLLVRVALFKNRDRLLEF